MLLIQYIIFLVYIFNFFKLCIIMLLIQSIIFLVDIYIVCVCVCWV